MSEVARTKKSYGDLYDLPENVIGEIIDGEIIATPRPSPAHSHVESALGYVLGPPYHLGRGGPGGWIILGEAEIMLGEHLLVPDLSGWKRERFPGVGETNWISVSPDWICEILSPSTLRIDKIRKMPLYALHGVPFLWLLDPSNKTLEVFRLESGGWLLLGAFAENDRVCAEPFPDAEIDLGNLWLE